MAKKGTVTLGADELGQIKSFYEQERIQLAARLQHVDQVISRLGGSTSLISGGRPSKTPSAPAPAPAVKRGPGRPRKAAVKDTKAKRAGRPKKRGPKSVWGNFILRRLRQCNRPLSYSELVRDAMVLNKIPAERAKNAKASVLNAAFRLRTTLKKIDTISLPGKKEKFLVLTSWIESEGKLKSPYDKLFKSVAATPMDDRGRKPRRPSEAKPAAKKTVRKAAAKPAAKKTVRKAAAKPAAKKTVRKAAAKPAAKKNVRKAAAKPAAKKTVRKAAAKPAAKKSTTTGKAVKRKAKKG